MTIPEALKIAMQQHQAGQLAAAEKIYREILALDSNHGDALHLLGVIAQQVGRHDLAVDLIRQAIAVNPKVAAYHSNLGKALSEQGQLNEAAAALREAVKIQPDDAVAQYNFGVALFNQGHLEEAIGSYRAAIKTRPDYAAAHYNLGVALQRRGETAEAIVAYRRTVELKPGDAEAHSNLGNALTAIGKLDEAISAFHRALELNPQHAMAHNNLGIALFNKRLLREAIAQYREAIAITPDYAEAHYNLGIALRDNGQLDEAISAYQRAFALQPDEAKTITNLGNALRDQGELEAAMNCYRRARDLDPEDASAQSNLIYSAQFQAGCDWIALEKEFRRWNESYGRPPERWPRPCRIRSATRRRLRIGYVSPDFCDHVVGRNLVPLFAHHDREAFEIFCYSSVRHPDRLTARFESLADHWRDALRMTDADLAEVIYEDAVEILVDLTQHMAGNRLPMFACKPAPIQVSFAGYPGSTGLEAIPYRMSDRFLEGAPAIGSSGLREQVCLIESFWCYDPCGLEVAASKLPAGERGFVTFGCLNNFCKVSEQTLMLWARVLQAVKGSRLVILSHEGSHRARTLEMFRTLGVELPRVEFVAPCPRKEYLELYQRLDVILDTFPYNGHTTSLDALWMGVPVVSLAGVMPVSRAGLSQLTNLKLTDLVAHTEEEYVRIAVEIARDLRRLAELRSSLRTRMAASPLMDGRGFARNVERAYGEMWSMHLARQLPGGTET